MNRQLRQLALAAVAGAMFMVGLLFTARATRPSLPARRPSSGPAARRIRVCAGAEERRLVQADDSPDLRQRNRV